MEMWIEEGQAEDRWFQNGKQVAEAQLHGALVPGTDGRKGLDLRVMQKAWSKLEGG